MKYHYQLRTDNISFQSGYFFPNLFPDESILQDGLIITKKNKKHTWKKKFEVPITDNIEFLYLDFRFYCVNIDSVQILMTKIDGDKIVTTIKVQENGYQIPYISPLKSWNKSFDLLDTLTISGISILGFSQSKTSNMVIGNLQLYSQKDARRAVYDPFFDELLGRNSFDIVTAHSFSFTSWPFLYVPFPFYLQMNRIHANNETIVSIPDSVDEKSRLLHNFMYYSLKHYPYYEEYEIDTVLFFKRINSWKSISYISLIDSFSKLINNMGDPHISFRPVKQIKKNEQKQLGNKQTPVRFATLNNRIYVVAVQNKNLTNIQLGDELLLYNSIEAKKMITYNDSKNSINRLMPISLKDDTQLVLRRGKDTIHTQLTYSDKNESLYKISHRKYTYENGICYYKLNNWESIEYFHFQNLLLEKAWSKDVKCIIFDLRNNGGGDEIAAAKIASCFIHTPHPFCHYSYTFLNNETIKDSWIISANPILNLADIPVIILTNRYTACASESFISFLKQYHSTTVISNDAHTSGAYSAPYVISIFGDILLRMPYMKHYNSSGHIIEKKGIAPDVYVQFKEVTDLAAIHDKVLQVAKKIAESLINK